MFGSSGTDHLDRDDSALRDLHAFRPRPRLADFVAREAGGETDRCAGLRTGFDVTRRYIHDPVRVDLERHFDRHLSARGYPEPSELELTEHDVLGREVGLALVHLDLHALLV